MRIHGRVRPPGDKSISHRALVLGALAPGVCSLEHALTSLDARSMAGVLRSLGIEISPLRQGATVRVVGRGLRGIRRPTVTLHCGNSGTAARFLLGLLAGFPYTTRITGDASLRRRPMRRVTRPLSHMGASFHEENGDGLPMVVTGGALRPLSYQSVTASAQVKGALIFAGLVAGVAVSVTEPARSRDHTERMLQALGVSVDVTGFGVHVEPVETLPTFSVRVPGDPSAAAFLVGAGLLADEGELVIEGVGMNPTRTGFLEVLRRMGADVETLETSQVLGEPVGDLVVRPSRLSGAEIAEAEVPSLIDEVPILAVVASRAEGETVFRGVGELRVKESDRLSLLAQNLRRLGVEAEAGEQTLTVRGAERPPRGVVETALDHRLAMAFAVLGTVRGSDVRLSEDRSPLVSYPLFFGDLRSVVHGG